jgi:predicted nucleic acid-binding protein
MTARVFVDSNVLVYERDSSEPDKQPLAEAWVRRLWEERTGRISFQVLQEFYVNVTTKRKPGLSPDEAQSRSPSTGRSSMAPSPWNHASGCRSGMR